MIIEGTDDIRINFFKMYSNIADGVESKTTFTSNKKNLFSDTTAPTWLGYIEKIKAKNSGNFIVGKSVTIADCALYDMLDIMYCANADILKPFPTIVAYMVFF